MTDTPKITYDVPTAKKLLGLLHDAPDSRLDKEMVLKLRELCKSEDHVTIRDGIHEVLDLCARYALASSFVMVHLDYTWRGMGGSEADPTPWRDDPMHYHAKEGGTDAR